MDVAIEVVGLEKRFGGIKAIDGLTLTIPMGVTTGLIGPNGSGKTTLMNVLTGLLTPEDGVIEIKGHKRRRIKPTDLRKLKIARTFQDGRLVEQMSVKDNLLLTVAETGYFRGLFDFEKSNKVDGILKKVHLREYRDVNAEALSYGQRKLLEIGRTLMQDADIYFFDEPFTGLFPEVVEQVMEILEELKKQGKTLVIIEHNMGLISRLCDFAVVLDYGKLLAEGKVKDVLKDEKVREAYLGK